MCDVTCSTGSWRAVMISPAWSVAHYCNSGEPTIASHIPEIVRNHCMLTVFLQLWTVLGFLGAVPA